MIKTKKQIEAIARDIKLLILDVDGLIYEGIPPEVFFVSSFDGNIPQGRVFFHDAFKADGQERAQADE